ncbi:MAG: DUF1003 domain-containing protein [Rhodoferax sp.]|nr:DUF1003 domain-containing protein [Rhodoferax sp.]
MSSKHQELARRLLGAEFDALDAQTRNATRHAAGHTRITRHPDAAPEDANTFGQRAADAVASFGGSWVFIGLFAAVLVFWVGFNSWLLSGTPSVFDPYPYVLLNLFLSMLAAIQAPIILMSQNRQSQKDRVQAEHDYEVNLKAELEIMLLHEKVDALRQGQWSDLLALQKEQLDLLASLATRQARAPSPPADTK